MGFYINIAFHTEIDNLLIGLIGVLATILIMAWFRLHMLRILN